MGSRGRPDQWRRKLFWDTGQWGGGVEWGQKRFSTHFFTFNAIELMLNFAKVEGATCPRCTPASAASGLDMPNISFPSVLDYQQSAQKLGLLLAYQNTGYE